MLKACARLPAIAVLSFAPGMQAQAQALFTNVRIFEGNPLEKIQLISDPVKTFAVTLKVARSRKIS